MVISGHSAPLYMTPPNTEAIRTQIRAGRLGAITTPTQGNKLEEGWWWCADNAVFQRREDGGAYPGDEEFLAWLNKLRPFRDRCLFAVAPDVPMNAFASVSRSYDMLHRIRDLGFPVALAAQDYMELCDWWDWEDFDCLFIGGSTRWKESQAAANLARVARSYGKHVHMGRVNTDRRARLATGLVDSMDGTTLAIAPDKNLPKAIGWRNAAVYDSPLPLEEAGEPPLDPYDGGYDLARWMQPEPPTPARPAVHAPGQLDLFALDAA